jgi:hypothetical protein
VIRRLRTLTREITALHPAALAAGPGDIVICGGKRTSTGVAVMKLARRGAPPSAVVKLAAASEAKRALARETATLATLHADRRLDGWRALLPRPLAQGSARGHSYRIDSALDGRAVTRPSAALAPALLLCAATSIGVLHEQTATAVGGGTDVVERWVDAPLRELLRHADGGRRLERRVDLLRDELHDALGSGTFPAAWIHGDCWLGNMLFTGTSAPTGIVDWEAAAPLELPLHDVLHLLLYARRLATGRELGQLLCDQLGRHQWSADERVFLGGQRAWTARGALSERHALLLYWLRHAAVHARQYRSPAGYRYRLWERRNVLPVLAAL